MKIRNVPFGYAKENGKIVINQYEANTVSEIFVMYISGNTLLAISERLTERGVVFFEENRIWNKNMVSRILEDERYLGRNKYPQLVDFDDFNSAMQVRAEKGSAKAVLSPVASIIKEKLHCTKCDRMFSRINKWKTREKWLCLGGCKCEIYLDDNTIINKILFLLNKAIDTPELLKNKNVKPYYEETTDVIRKTNEIYRMMDQTGIDYRRVVEAIFDCATERYNCCVMQNRNQLTDTIISELLQYGHLEELNTEMLKRFIVKIEIDEKGKMTLHLQGNITLTDEMEDNENGSSTESCNKN